MLNVRHKALRSVCGVALLAAALACGRAMSEKSYVTPAATAPVVATATATLTVAPSPTPSPPTRVSPSPTVAPEPLPPQPTSSATATPVPVAPAATPTSAPFTPAPTSATAPTPAPPTSAPPTEPPRDWSLAQWETDITLTTYGWEQALLPTTPDDAVYPYPRLNAGAVGSPASRAYHAVVLENGYVRVIVLPELGGRIWSWEDKVTGQRLTYANPVIKPTGWGYRGWWLATGGLEWAFPVDEHGLNEWRPWQYEPLAGNGWRGVRVWDTDSRTGLTVEVTLRLYAGRSELFISPNITNPTATAQPFQFWINAMLTLSGANVPSANVRFWIPTEQVIVHSTGDGSLPGAGGALSWPLYNGRDFSRYAEWRSYLGVFAAQTRGAVAAYDEVAEQGVVRSYPPGVASGVKIFCLGDLPASLYTDDGSRYFELWGGYTRTFWEYAQLAPGGAATWEERWYPVHAIGGVTWANGDMAAALRAAEGAVTVGLYAPNRVAARLVLRQNGAAVAEWEVIVGPSAPFRTTYAGSGGGWDLQIWQEGVLVAQLGPS